MADCLIGLGSNVGNRAAQLDQAIARICGCPQVTLCGTSRYHETPPIGGPDGQGPFLNAAIRVTTELSPQQMLTRVRQVERELGRVRLERWGPRAIDIDVLLYDLLIMTTDELVIPHPRMAVRRFVLEPACEVAAEMVHATTRWPLQQLLTRLDQLPCYIAVCCADQRRSTGLVAAATQRLLATPLFDNTGLSDSAGTTNASPQSAVRLALDSLARRCQLLESIDASRKPDSLFLSDFWLNQSLALARTWPPGPERAQLQQACRVAIPQAPQPRFVLYLDLPAVATTTQLAAPPTGDTRSRSTLASCALQLDHQVATAGQGPVLHVSAEALDAALVELQAGVDAMR